MRLSLSLLLGAASAAVAKAVEPTTFNDVTVPPMLELTPDNWETESQSATWLLVKHYSPYCHHCAAFAPTYQTMYEFYYTSKPEGAGSNANFTDFYDFKFATINCVAYYDLCSKNDVKSYPTTTLYKKGEVSEVLRGAKDMESLGKLIEDALVQTKPGTRPATVSYPEAGAKNSPGYVATESTAEKTWPSTAAADAEKILEKTSAAAADDSIGKDTAQMPIKDTVRDSARDITDSTAKLNAAATEADAKNAATAQGATARDAAAADSTTGAAKDTSKVATKTSEDDAPVRVKAAYKPQTTWTKRKSSKAQPANPNGMSVPLTAENFQSMVTMTQDPWFIKFYAPWCHHCQALAPNWEQLGKEMTGKLNIGEVNCDRERHLCKDVGLRGYPTIILFKGSERVEYDGLRGIGDLIQFANKATELADGIQDVDAATLATMEEKEEAIFVYFYDYATTSEDFISLERLSLSLIGHAKIVRTSDPELFERFKITTWPRLLVSREGRPTYYNPLTPREMRDPDMLLPWMKSVWLPIVPELTATNAREIMDGKIVVLGILNREDQESFTSAKRELKTAANEWMEKQIQKFQLERQELRDSKQMRIEEAEDRGDQRALRSAKSIRISMDKSDTKEVAFAWVDAVFWQRWIRTTYGIDVKDGDRIIINDEDRRRYWDRTISGSYILPSRTSIQETLNKVTQQPPKIKAKLTISAFEKVLFDIRRAFIDHRYIMIGVVGITCLVLTSWYRRSRRRNGHVRLSADEHRLPTILGGGVTANGKKD